MSALSLFFSIMDIRMQLKTPKMCLFHYWLGPHNLIVLIVEMMGVVQVSLVTIYASSLGHNWVKSFLKKYALYHRE